MYATVAYGDRDRLKHRVATPVIAYQRNLKGRGRDGALRRHGAAIPANNVGPVHPGRTIGSTRPPPHSLWVRGVQGNADMCEGLRGDRQRPLCHDVTLAAVYAAE